MRNLKKLLALVLAFMMAMSLMVTAHADFDEAYSDRNDVKLAYGDAVDFLKGLGAFRGFEDGSFKPKEPITRAEVAAIVYRVLTGDVGDDQIDVYKGYDRFSDVLSADARWFEPYVNYCANGLYVHGDPDGKFRPNDNITGYEVLAIMLRALGYGVNGEYEGDGWNIRTATTANRLEITANVQERLSEDATREMVAEILYQTVFTPMVDYTYTYEKAVLVADSTANRRAYNTYMTNGGELPIYDTLVYHNFGIVGAPDVVEYDVFGRPCKTWYVDQGTVAAGTKYVYDAADTDDAFSLNYVPVKIYDNVITECDMTKDVNEDKSFTADVYLNGVEIAAGYQVDKVHTVDTYVNAPGRTLEVFRTDAGWRLVFIDTFLGVVTNVTKHTDDTAGHLMQQATLTVGIGHNVTNNTYTKTVTFTSDTDYDYSAGDLVLVQTPNGDANVFTNGTPMPNTYDDVPVLAADFDGTDSTNNRQGAKPRLAGDISRKVTVTVQGTKGEANYKNGITTTDGETYWLTNVYMRSQDTTGDTLDTTPAAYDTLVANDMINRTYELTLAEINDTEYVVGVRPTSSVNVGVITGAEAHRVGPNRYAVSVELMGFDGNSRVVEFLKQNRNYFESLAAAEDAILAAGISTDGSNNDDDCTLQYNFLIAYQNVNETYAYRVDVGSAAIAVSDDTINGSKVRDAADANDLSTVLTGVTDTLADTPATLIDDNTQFLIANYAPDYSAGTGNAGTMMMQGYRPYTGFKTIPTIYAAAADNDVLYTVLDWEGVRYAAIYAQNETNGYVMRGQSTFAIDDSYLALKPNTTFQYHSNYEMLKNGEKVPNGIDVANTNAAVNTQIEACIATNKAGAQLITFTGIDAIGHYSSILPSTDAGHFNNVAADTSIVADGTYPSYSAGVLTVAANTYLTMAADVQVVIVNAAQGTTYPGTLESIAQYASNADVVDGTGRANAFVWELNSYGYISCLYIID